MSTLVMSVSSEEDFFRRGREVARKADQGEALPEEKILSFEDPSEMLGLLTSARLALFRAVREQPGSITFLAQRLHRDRSAVKRDVDELLRAGLVRVESKSLPGHGRMKEVSSVADTVRLEAVLP
jgi:predicted transcriptional regulator